MNGIAVYKREADPRSLSRQTERFVTAPTVHAHPLPMSTAPIPGAPTSCRFFPTPASACTAYYRLIQPNTTYYSLLFASHRNTNHHEQPPGLHPRFHNSSFLIHSYTIFTGPFTGYLPFFDSCNGLCTRHLCKFTTFYRYFFVMPPFTTCHLPFRFAPSLPFAICHLPFRSSSPRLPHYDPGGGGPVKARETSCERFLKGLCDLEKFDYEPLAKIERF
jgi:hypothetical protein